jgi:hypothetical protein
MSNVLAVKLTLSARLAERWAAVTPDMELAWNPRDEKSLVDAVGRWLTYVDKHLFPVQTWVRTMEEAGEALHRACLQPQGHDLLMVDYYGQYDVEDVMFHFLMLDYLIDMDLYEDMQMSLETMRESWRFEAVAPLHRVADWLESQLYRAAGKAERPLVDVFDEAEPEAGQNDEQAEPGEFPQDVAFWTGMLHFMRYYLQSTPHDILNEPNSEDADHADYIAGHSCDWLDETAVARLAEAWREADQYLKPSRRFWDWCEARLENTERAVAVLQQGCKAVRETGWKSWGADWERVNGLLPFAGTPLWEEALEYGPAGDWLAADMGTDEEE